MRWLVPAIAAVSYVVGTVAHELTHLGVARLTGSEILEISWWPTYVEYDPATPICDPIIRASTLGVTPAIIGSWLAVVVLWPSAITLSLLGGVIGYIPRSRTDWHGLWLIIIG